MLISATTGMENFPSGSSKFHLFFVPTLQHPGKETHIGVMTRGANPEVPITTVGAPRHFPAAPGMREELGKWTQATYDVPEGAVLKVFGYLKRSNQQYPNSGSQLIRLREGAALRRVSFATLGWDRGQFQNVTIEGRFDLLSLEEAQPMGVRVPPMYQRSFEPAAAARVMTASVLTPEVVSRPKVEARTIKDSAGREVEVVTARRTRDLSL